MRELPWYEQSLRWTPDVAEVESWEVWWSEVQRLDRPTRLLISAALHQRLQHKPLNWPAMVVHVDTVLTGDVKPTVLSAWQHPPASWGWWWQTSLGLDTPLPEPRRWPVAPFFRVEMVVTDPSQLPHAASWWLRWSLDPERATLPLEVMLDQTHLSEPLMRAWDRWSSRLAPLIQRSNLPISPWNAEFTTQDPRWDPERHRRWTTAGWVLDRPRWCSETVETNLVLAPCPDCPSKQDCPGSLMPARWATPAPWVCTEGSSWRQKR